MSALFRDAPFTFPADQRPAVPGGPARPAHPPPRRVAYGIVGTVLGLTSGLGNALIQVNSTNLQGALGADAYQLAWIPTAYVTSYITTNLLLTRLRQKFGLRPYAMAGIALFSLVAFVHLLVRDWTEEVFVQVAAGFASAPLISLSTYYLISAMTPANALRGAVLAFGISQLATPLARLVPIETLALDRWRALHELELGIALVCMTAVALVRLPPSDRSDDFERLDLATYPLLATGMALVVAVLGLGRIEWWTDRPWLGWALALAIPLLAIGFYIESRRARPLIDLRWLGRQRLFQFGLVVIVLRIALAEQTSVAYGLLGQHGLVNADLQRFSFALLGAAVAGIVAAVLVYKPDRVLAMGLLAFTIIAVSAWIDSHASSLTRAPQLYATQMAVAFATTFGIGPTLLHGLVRTFGSSATPLTSFLALLAITQASGAMLGSALLGTFQIVREKAVSVELISRVAAFDPVVQARIAGAGGGHMGTAVLQEAMSREASVVAYTNCFALVSALSTCAALYLLYRIVVTYLDARQLPAVANGAMAP